MKKAKVLTAGGLAVAVAVLLACTGGNGEGIGSSQPTGNNPVPREQAQPVLSEMPAATPAPVLSFEPVPLSQIKTQPGQPLASGFSVADVVENALLSVVEVRTNMGNGTGFIVDAAGIVVTNLHVVSGVGVSAPEVSVASGNRYGARIIAAHGTLDIAYLSVDSDAVLTPIALGDSDAVRVGDEVVVIGFPLSGTMGEEPTVSRGIISARRDGLLQTDAPVNPGNSGGPLLDQSGNVIGVITSRAEADESGRLIAGIGFAVPINPVKETLNLQPPQVLKEIATPTPIPTSTPLPMIAPTPDLEATKAAIDAVAEHRRAVELATRTAIEAQAEAERYAAGVEATRIAEIPTATPEPTPTPTPVPEPTPTPTPHPSVYCREWEALVLDWVKQGNNYGRHSGLVPVHPKLPHHVADRVCITDFPDGRLFNANQYAGIRGLFVGPGNHELLPGTYQYEANGDNRVNNRPRSLAKAAGHPEAGCLFRVNQGEPNETIIPMVYGDPFEIKLYAYHNHVSLDLGNWGCYGSLRRTGE